MFVNEFDDWEADTLELNDSSYIPQVIGSNHVLVFYNAANHRLYMELAQSKSPETTVEIFDRFHHYAETEMDDQFVDIIISDMGSEFAGAFSKRLLELEIGHHVVNTSINDNLQLSPINAMCRYIRTQIYLIVSKLPEQVTKEQLESIVKEVFVAHNSSKTIPLYKKAPNDITRDEVEETNEEKLYLNREKDDKAAQFKIGDVVQILLKKERLEKARKQKWSDGLYRIIDRQGQHFLLSPEHFNFEEYMRAHEFSDSFPFSIPVYFRKHYEMRKPTAEKASFEKYHVFETEHFAKQYQFVKIIEPMKKEKGAYVKAPRSDINRFLFRNDDENRFYKIQVQQGSEQPSFIVPLKCLRVDDIEAISAAEYECWFGHK